MRAIVLVASNGTLILARCWRLTFRDRRDVSAERGDLRVYTGTSSELLASRHERAYDNERIHSPCESGGQPRSSRAPCRHSPSLFPLATFLPSRCDPDESRLDRQKSHPRPAETDCRIGSEWIRGRTVPRAKNHCRAGRIGPDASACTRSLSGPPLSAATRLKTTIDAARRTILMVLSKYY